MLCGNYHILSVAMIPQRESLKSRWESRAGPRGPQQHSSSQHSRQSLVRPWRRCASGRGACAPSVCAAFEPFACEPSACEHRPFASCPCSSRPCEPSVSRVRAVRVPSVCTIAPGTAAGSGVWPVRAVRASAVLTTVCEPSVCEPFAVVFRARLLAERVWYGKSSFLES